MCYMSQSSLISIYNDRIKLKNHPMSMQIFMNWFVCSISLICLFSIDTNNLSLKKQHSVINVDVKCLTIFWNFVIVFNFIFLFVWYWQRWYKKYWNHMNVAGLIVESIPKFLNLLCFKKNCPIPKWVRNMDLL